VLVSVAPEILLSGDDGRADRVANGVNGSRNPAQLTVLALWQRCRADGESTLRGLLNCHSLRQAYGVSLASLLFESPTWSILCDKATDILSSPLQGTRHA